MRHEVQELSDGWRGTEETVGRIRSLVEASILDPVVVTTAQNLVRNLPERDKDAEINAISSYVRGKIRYTNEGVETLKTPRLLLDEIRRYGKAVGDCDDHVILWLALHRAVGSKARVRVVSQRKDRLANHIYGEVWSPTRGWVADELIVKSKPLGWAVPSRQLTASVAYSMDGMNGGLGMMHRRMDLFSPGGTRRMEVSTWGYGPGSSATPDYVTRDYSYKPGTGAITIDTNGELAGTLGFLGPLVGMATAAYGAYKEKKAAKKEAKKAKLAAAAEAAAAAAAAARLAMPPGAPPAPTPEDRKILGLDPTMLLLLGGGLALVLILGRK